MAISKEQKKEIAAKLDTALTSTTTVFVSYKNIGVNDLNVLRKRLKDYGVTYFVTKKTLLKRAMDKATAEGNQPDLGDGMIALAFGEDQMAPAREIFSFGKEHKDTVEIIGGIFDGAFKSREEMIEIATIPDMHTLRGMFANLLNSPLQRFAVVLNQVAEQKEA